MFIKYLIFLIIILFSLLIKLAWSSKNLTNLINESLAKQLSGVDIFNSSEYQTNIALNYWNEWKNYPKIDNWKEYKEETCNTSIPDISKIEFNNIYWQTVSNENRSEYFLYNAYYDNREDNNFVRIIGTQRRNTTMDLW